VGEFTDWGQMDFWREVLQLREKACVTVQQALPGVELVIRCYPPLQGDREELWAKGVPVPLAKFYEEGDQFFARVCPLAVEVARRALFIRGERGKS
jgi:hypothetical protein